MDQQVKPTADAQLRGLIPDHPIRKASQDRLGRAEQAKILARNIRSFDDPGALIVGLYGSWGSGKTSLLHMVADELKGSSVSHKPIVIWFNPWHFKTTDDLIRAFFRALHFKESSSGKEQIGKALDALAFVATVGDITPAAPITKSVAKGLKWASNCCQSANVGRIRTRENRRYGEPALSSLTVRL